MTQWPDPHSPLSVITASNWFWGGFWCQEKGEWVEGEVTKTRRKGKE